MLDAAKPSGFEESENIPVLIMRLHSLLESHTIFWKFQRNALTLYLDALAAGKVPPPLDIPNLSEITGVLPGVLSETKFAAQTLLEPLTK